METKTLPNNPQVENGYTRIAHEILENLIQINLSAYQTRVLLYIFRKTYGYGKKDDWISVTQIVEATGIHKSHISRTKKELLARGLVTSYGNKIAFQKDSRLWKELPKQVTAKKVTNSGRKVTNSGQKLPVQADTIDNIQKIITIDRVSGETSVNSFLRLFEKVNPSYKILYGNKTQRKSAANLLKKYGAQKMTNLLGALPKINQRPYAPIITTPHELEVKMGKLLAFLKQEEAKNIKSSLTKV